jgi:hypothetical protein
VSAKYMTELNEKLRKRFFSSKYSLAKNLDGLDPKIVMSPDYSNLSIVPLLAEFPNLAKETDVENIAKK